MTKIIIETNDSKNKIRKLSDEALTEVEQLFEEKITVFLTDFMCDKKFFGLYRSYYWKEEPKMSIRMFLFNFGLKIHILSPNFSIALPASFAGAVNRISESFVPLVQPTKLERRSHVGLLINIVISA